MRRKTILALGLLAAVVMSACSKSSTTAAPSAAGGGTASSGTATAQSMMGADSLPQQSMISLPSFPAYYDAHTDVVTVTDAYPQAAATAYDANYAPALAAVPPASQPLWYVVKGPAATGQITVLGSEPGETNYSPLWRTVNVKWSRDATPVLLTSDAMIDHLAGKGELTETTTNAIVNATVLSVGK